MSCEILREYFITLLSYKKKDPDNCPFPSGCSFSLSDNILCFFSTLLFISHPLSATVKHFCFCLCVWRKFNSILLSFAPFGHFNPTFLCTPIYMFLSFADVLFYMLFMKIPIQTIFACENTQADRNHLRSRLWLVQSFGAPMCSFKNSYKKTRPD